MSTASPSLQQIKDNMRATWMAGDFGEVAKTVASAAEEFARGLGIAAGLRVLDVACGTGNLSIPLARQGAVVTGVDIATNLLAQARVRAGAVGVSATFDEGDAEQLPYPSSSFDAAVTMFGAMFAPRPDVVVEELARVLKPGGLLAMANWNPESFSGKIFKVGSRHVPPPPHVSPPVLWGDEKTVRGRLETKFKDVTTELVQIEFDLPTNAAGCVTFFRTYFGPTKMAFERLDETGQKAFASELEALWAEANFATDPDRQMRVKNEYLKVTARKV